MKTSKYTENLLHGDESSVHADAGYMGMEKCGEMRDRKPNLRHCQEAHRGAQASGWPAAPVDRAEQRSKAQFRAIDEHPLHVVKNLLRHPRLRYRGSAKNTAQLFGLVALANLVLARRLLPPQGTSAS